MPELVNGALYVVRWNVYPEAEIDIARWRSNLLDPHRDPGEEPRERWEFFANDETGAPSDYDVLCRLKLMPVLTEPMTSGLAELIEESNRA